MYVVTGGAGFIGSNLVVELSARGAEGVVGDYPREDGRWRNLAKHEISDVIVPDALNGWLERNVHAVEAVLHLGANSSTTETNDDLIVRQNVRSTIDLFG